MKDLEKLEDCLKGSYERQSYFKEMNVIDIRIMFRIRTKMVPAKFNFKNMKNYSRELWKCDSCETAIESQSHILWCPAYQQFRAGKNLKSDKDLVQYMKKVLKIRQEQNISR